MKRTKQLNDARGEYSPLVQPYSIIDDEGKQVLPSLIKKVDTLATESKSFITSNKLESRLKKVKQFKSISEIENGDYGECSIVIDTSVEDVFHVPANSRHNILFGKRSFIGEGNDNLCIAQSSNIVGNKNKIFSIGSKVSGDAHVVLGDFNNISYSTGPRVNSTIVLGNYCDIGNNRLLAIGTAINSNGANSCSIGLKDPILVVLTGKNGVYSANIKSTTTVKLEDLLFSTLYKPDSLNSNRFVPITTNSGKPISISRISDKTITTNYSCGDLNTFSAYVSSTVNKGSNSLIIGCGVNLRNSSFIIGNDNYNDNENSYLFGTGLISSTTNNVIFGRYNELREQKDRVFVVGQGNSNSSRKDILWSNSSGDIYIKQKLYVAEDKEVATKEDVTTSIDNKFVVTDSIADSDIEEGKIYLIY